MPAEIPAFNRTTAGLMARIRAGRTGTSGALADVTNLGVQVGFAPTSFGAGETRRRAWEVAQRRKEREARAWLTEIQDAIQRGDLPRAAEAAAAAAKESEETVPQDMANYDWSWNESAGDLP